MRTDLLCVSVLRVKFASCKSALPHPPPPGGLRSTDHSKAVVPVLVLLFVALWFILGKRELILVLFVRLFG